MENSCLAARPIARCSPAPSDLGHELTLGFAGRYIRHKARQLIGAYGYVAADLPDLEQELVLRLLERLKKFDVGRAPWNSFVVAVVDRQVATIVVARQAVKRGPRINVLAQTFADDDGSLDLTQLPNHCLHGSEVPADPHQDLELVELQQDIAVVVRRLPYKLRITWDWLQSETIRGTARGLRVSRQTIYQRIQQLRAAFITVELGNSSQKNQTPRS